MYDRLVDVHHICVDSNTRAHTNVHTHIHIHVDKRWINVNLKTEKFIDPVNVIAFSNRKQSK